MCIRDRINRALTAGDPLSVVPSADPTGHGTFLAGIAAGKESSTDNFRGVAPDASLIVVRLKTAKQYLRELFLLPADADVYQEDDIMLAISFVLSCSGQMDTLPVSLCIGLGTSLGSHSGTSPLSQYADRIARQFADVYKRQLHACTQRARPAAEAFSISHRLICLPRQERSFALPCCKRLRD